ncbi:MAG: hypothetical protein KAS93_07245 [Gammaproteobacteria bacterium]|nr:hypothetical protein [Gammaproteobacteria bacterium]
MGGGTYDGWTLDGQRDVLGEEDEVGNVQSRDGSLSDVGLGTEGDGMVPPMALFADERFPVTSFMDEGSLSSTDPLLNKGEGESVSELAAVPAKRGFFGQFFDVASGVTTGLSCIVPVEFILGVINCLQSDECTHRGKDFWDKGESFANSEAGKWTGIIGAFICCFPCAASVLAVLCCEKTDCSGCSDCGNLDFGGGLW